MTTPDKKSDKVPKVHTVTKVDCNKVITKWSRHLISVTYGTFYFVLIIIMHFSLANRNTSFDNFHNQSENGTDFGTVILDLLF